ncbi:MAG: TlpA family protein disulfide reductase [Wenzhouxiangella sp.]
MDQSVATRARPGRLGRASIVLLALAWLVTGAAAEGSDSTAPDTRFEAVNGSMASLNEHHGTVVVLNFWATWCSPCLIEIPHLVDLQQRLEPLGATVIGLTLDSGDARIIKQFWRNRLEIEPNYPLWLASVDQAAELFDVRTFPQTLLIDRDGKVRKRLLGLQTEDDLWIALQAYL